MNLYGVLDRNDCHIDITQSLKGAKRFATLNGYDKVSYRNSNSYNVIILFQKVNGKWVEFLN